ncbi:hypothetical protein Tco_1004101 [Tanacetum coccineum]|uniref:Uncharacterized protein n=1 Tax=Tanacetum coccineum TaxID=301880 RepID=A0ABQ5FAX7_9ASTR
MGTSPMHEWHHKDESLSLHTLSHDASHKDEMENMVGQATDLCVCLCVGIYLKGENYVNDDVGSMDKYEGHEGSLMEDNDVESVADNIYDKGVPRTTVIDEFNQEKEHVIKKTVNIPHCVAGNDDQQMPMDSDPFGLDPLIK